MSREWDIQSAIAAVKGTGNLVSDKKIYIKAKQLPTGEAAATSMGINGWGAVDYLRAHGFGVVYEMLQTQKQKDNSFTSA